MAIPTKISNATSRETSCYDTRMSAGSGFQLSLSATTQEATRSHQAPILPVAIPQTLFNGHKDFDSIGTTLDIIDEVLTILGMDELDLIQASP